MWDGFVELVKTQGPIIGILCVIAYYFIRRSDKAYDMVIKEKNLEIDRIAAQRDKFQDLVLNNRLSSDNPGDNNGND